MSKKIKYLLMALLVLVVTGAVLFFCLSNRNDSTIDETATGTVSPSENVYEKLDEVYISVSHNYINALFGEPKVSVRENETLKSNFYLLDDIVLRTVIEDDSVVAFFITSMNEQRKITVKSIDSDKVIGETDYIDTDFATPETVASFSGNGRYNYYAEIQGTGRYAMYNYYLFATLPYGFIDDESAELCREYGVEDSDSMPKDESLRATATPNTFGVIADGYEEVVTLIPEVNNWADIYYLLTK